MPKPGQLFGASVKHTSMSENKSAGKRKGRWTKLGQPSIETFPMSWMKICPRIYRQNAAKQDKAQPFFRTCAFETRLVMSPWLWGKKTFRTTICRKKWWGQKRTLWLNTDLITYRNFLYCKIITCGHTPGMENLKEKTLTTTKKSTRGLRNHGAKLKLTFFPVFFLFRSMGCPETCHTMWLYVPTPIPCRLHAQKERTTTEHGALILYHNFKISHTRRVENRKRNTNIDTQSIFVQTYCIHRTCLFK